MMAAIAGVPAAEVTIYRCTDAQGRLTLRDTPCRKGERQETRTMQRPTDPPRRSMPKVIGRRQRAKPPRRRRAFVVQPPRPLYECVTPDGAIYTSESGEGNPRWVPLWTLGYPVWGPRGRFDHGRVDARVR